MAPEIFAQLFEDGVTTTYGLLELCVYMLKAADTPFLHRVYSPGDWQTWDEQYPYLRAKVKSEEKESWGRNGPRFTVVGTVSFSIYVAKKGAPDDAGAARAEQLAWRLERLLETTLINRLELKRAGVQQIPAIHAHDVYDASGAQHYGAVQVDIAFEFIQDLDAFAPVPTVPLQQLGVIVDSANIFDRTGTYAGAPFPAAVKPAPRTSGPDGRIEGELVIDLPQN